MRVSLSAGTLRFYGLDRVFSIAADLGFDGVELIVDARADSTDPSYLIHLSERYGMPIPTLHSPFSFVETPAWGPDPVVRMEKSIMLAEEIGSEVVIVHMPFFAECRYARWVREEIPRRQRETRVKIAVENMPVAYKILGRLGAALNLGTFYAVDSGKGINRLLKPFSRLCFLYNDWESLLSYPYVVLDTTHLATGGIDPVEAYERLKSRCVLIHLSNFDGREHQPMRRGRLDLDAFLRHVIADGYDGHLVFEYMPEYFTDGTEATARRMLSADLALVREIVEGRGAGGDLPYRSDG